MTVISLRRRLVKAFMLVLFAVAISSLRVLMLVNLREGPVSSPRLEYRRLETRVVVRDGRNYLDIESHAEERKGPGERRGGID
jgi:hypothetical protein